MSTQKVRYKWTEENINYLKTAYLQGIPLKQIAAKLDRTVSAVNKVLDRHKLRTHHKMSHFPSLLRPTLCQLVKQQNLGSQVRRRNRKKEARLLADPREWVFFERVISWMKTEGVLVTKSTSDVYYDVNGYPKSKAQLLYMANLRREELQLPVFFVKGVTCL